MAEFRIDQVTPGAGVSGRTRHDLVPGEVITLVATSPTGPGITYTWEILDKVGSVAVLSASTGQTVEIGPAGSIVRPCSFRIRLTVNDNGVITSMTRRASVRTAVTGMFVPLFPEAAPTSGTLASHNPDSSEDNAVYTDRAGLGIAEQNWRGWAEWAYEMVLAVESGGGAGGPPTGPAGGDLGGTYPNPDVTRLRGRTIENVAPANNNYLRWDSGTLSWRPTAFPTGLPPTGAAGGDLADNYPNPTVSGLLGIPLEAGTPTVNDIFRYDGTEWKHIYHGSFIDGSAAAPSITFGSDPDTGMFSTGVNKFALGAGGAAKLSFNVDTVIAHVPVVTADGSASAPGFSFESDQNTGLYRVAESALGVATDGAIRLAVSTTGIDAAVPFRAVSGTAANPGYEFVADQSSGMFLGGSIGSSVVGLSTNGAEVASFTGALNGASGDESVLGLTATVNKAAGNYSGIRIDVTETLAPGTDNRLLDLQVGGVSRTSVSNDGRLLVSDGIAATPSLSFISDPDTGVYSGGANVLSFAVAGVQRAYVNTTALNISLPIFPTTVGTLDLALSARPFKDGYINRVLAADGSNAAPSITFQNQLSTGLYVTGTNSMGIAAGGTSRMIINSTNTRSLADFLPFADVTYDLGSPALRWDSIYANSVVSSAASTFADGIVTAPGIAFTNEPGTGIWRDPANSELAISSNGVEIARFQAPGGIEPQVVVGLGTAARPSIKFGTVQSGLYSVSSQVMVTYNGVGRWAFGSNTLHALNGGQNLIRSQAVGSYFMISGRSDLSTSTNPSVTIENYSSLPFVGANIGQSLLRLTAAVNQTGTSEFTALDINVTETAVGSGAQYLINAQTGGVSKFSVSGGVVAETPIATFNGAHAGAHIRLVADGGVMNIFGNRIGGEQDLSVRPDVPGFSVTVAGSDGPDDAAGGSTRLTAGAGGADGGLGGGPSGEVVIGAPYTNPALANGSVIIFAGVEPVSATPGSVLVMSDGQLTLNTFGTEPLSIYGSKAGTDAIFLDAFTAGGAISFRTESSDRARVENTGIRVLDGSTTVPSISGFTDANSGLSFTSNAIRFLIGGSRGAELTSTGMSLREAGSAATPAIRNLTHTTTGLFWPSVAEIAIATQGSEVARFMGILNDAVSDEVAFGITATVNKAGGNYTLIKGNVTETAAPGSDRLLDLQVGGVSQFIVDNVGRVNADAGAATAPGYRFTSDGNSGYYWVSGDLTAIAGGGVDIVQFSAPLGVTPQILAAASSAAEPVYSFAADTNTGIYRSAENVLSISASGVERFHVNTSGANTTSRWGWISDGDTYIQRPSADQLAFVTGGTSRLDITTADIQPAVVVRGISGSAGSPPYSFSIDPDTGMFREGVNALGFSTGGVQRLSVTTSRLLPVGTTGTISLGNATAAFGEIWQHTSYIEDTSNGELSDTTVVGRASSTAGSVVDVHDITLKLNRAMILEVKCVAIENGGTTEFLAEHVGYRVVTDGAGTVTVAGKTKIYRSNTAGLPKSEISVASPAGETVRVSVSNDIGEPDLEWSLTSTWRQVIN